ncbi:10439_t:CDS:1, partial [Ambispora leptoticha]
SYSQVLTADISKQISSKEDKTTLWSNTIAKALEQRKDKYFDTQDWNINRITEAFQTTKMLTEFL